MLCIQIENNDTFFCLAAEEYLLKNFTEDIFMLWQSTNSVVVGKHQNALAEIDFPFVHRKKIDVARRISGGGSVFHDSGNVNFTFIKNVKSAAEISFRLFTLPVVEALAKLGITASLSGRSDLIVGGKKISGNAQHVLKNRVLHHGTLLFNSNLETLGNSLNAAPGKYHGKAVQSVRSVVTNILPLLENNRSIADFNTFLMNEQLKNPDSKIYKLSAEDNQKIQELVQKKFSTWEWNYGYSPKYNFTNEYFSEDKKLEIELKVEKGKIVESNCSGDFFSSQEMKILNESFHGVRHIYWDIRQKLEKIYPAVPDELVFSFF